MSVAIQHPDGRSGPVPRARWTPAGVEIVKAICLKAIRGVGDVSRAHWEDGDVALHLRRPMTPAEAKWMPRSAPIFTGQE